MFVSLQLHNLAIRPSPSTAMTESQAVVKTATCRGHCLDEACHLLD